MGEEGVQIERGGTKGKLAVRRTRGGGGRGDTGTQVGRGGGEVELGEVELG